MIKNFSWYLLPVLMFTFLYILSFSFVSRSFFSVPLLGPIGILLFLSLLMAGVLKLMVSYFSPVYFNGKDIAIAVILFFFINYSIYGMIPFNTSRSNSILIIGYLFQNEGMPKSKNEIEDHVKKAYFDKYNAIQRRLNEQEKAGNIAEVNGKYFLTTRGKFITKLFANVSDLYQIEYNFAKGQ